jgi:hypothetical protein
MVGFALQQQRTEHDLLSLPRIIMKTKAFLFIFTASLLHAESPEMAMTPAPKTEPWFKPLVDVRVRYEYADIDGLDQSNALTIRERLGFKTKKINGFSLLVEGEFTQVPVGDYNAGAGNQAHPYDPKNSPIGDPRTNELNQAYLKYEGYDTVARAGRQQIVYDKAAFIGDVIWRQNQQTYDAVSFTNKSIDGLTFDYAYIGQVNRIFGSEADSPLTANFSNVQDLKSDIHLFHGIYTGVKGVTLGGYAYLMDFEDREGWDNNTFGVSATGDALGLTLYGEFAVQGDAGAKNEDTAYYTHFTVTKNVGKQAFILGLEYLDAGLQTPLSTVHAFNGWADAFIGGRVEGNHNGLADLYVSHSMPIFYGMKWTNLVHAYGDSEISADIGWEFNSLLVKKFNDNFTAIAKLGLFESEGDAFVGAKAVPTAARFSLEMNYTF